MLSGAIPAVASAWVTPEPQSISTRAAPVSTSVAAPPRSAQAQQCPGRKRSLNGDVSREARRRTTLQHSDGAAIGCDDPRAKRDALYAK